MVSLPIKKIVWRSKKFSARHYSDEDVITIVFDAFEPDQSIKIPLIVMCRASHRDAEKWLKTTFDMQWVYVSDGTNEISIEEWSKNEQ